MSQTAITLAFEHWKAQQGATGEPVLLDEFVFANVPGLKPGQQAKRLPKNRLPVMRDNLAARVPGKMKKN